MVIAVVCLPGVMSAETGFGLCKLADRIDSITPYSAHVSYAVALPMADDDIVYQLDIATSRNPSDPLLGYNYLIDWQLPVETGISEGFTAYFDGHHYRYRDHRLQENHFQWDSIPFISSAGGIQRNGQFVDLLPENLALQLREMATDTTYSVTLTDNSRSIDVRGSRRVNGYESRQIEMLFDHDGLPLKYSVLYNPGMLGEQEVNATYNYTLTPAIEAVTNEEDLMARYPEIFGKYRVSNYSVENLRGLPLPAFALPTLTRERYQHPKGQPFTSPAIIAVLDPMVASTPSTIATLRATVDTLPRQTLLIMIFASNDTDTIESLTAPERPGEVILTSGAPFIRDCGINAYPTILLCNSDATVAYVTLGISSSLADDLTQGGALLK